MSAVHHASVQMWEERHHTDDEAAEPEGKVQESEENPSLSDCIIVPTIRARLLQSVSILPLRSIAVQVKIAGSDGLSGPPLLENWCKHGKTASYWNRVCLRHGMGLLVSD